MPQHMYNIRTDTALFDIIAIENLFNRHIIQLTTNVYLELVLSIVSNVLIPCVNDTSRTQFRNRCLTIWSTEWLLFAAVDLNVHFNLD